MYTYEILNAESLTTPSFGIGVYTKVHNLFPHSDQWVSLSLKQTICVLLFHLML